MELIPIIWLRLLDVTSNYLYLFSVLKLVSKFSMMHYLVFREVPRTAGVSTTDVVGRMLLLTREHFRNGTREYDVGKESSSAMGLDSSARSPWTGCSQFLPTTSKIIQFSSGKSPQVMSLTGKQSFTWLL